MSACNAPALSRTRSFFVRSTMLGPVLVWALTLASCASRQVASPQAPAPRARLAHTQVPPKVPPTPAPDQAAQVASVAPEPEPKATSPSLPAPTKAEIDELLLAAEAGDPEDLLEIMEYQDKERRPWELQAQGPLLSAQGPEPSSEYDKTVQDALYSAYTVEPHGQAVGRPNRGHLKNGVPLPDEPDLYTIRSKRAGYASSHTALQVVTAFRNFRQQTGYKGEIIIGDISAKQGGSYRTHHSHQCGRDLDILMPLMPGHKRWGQNIDWDTTWALVRAFLDTHEVQYVFLDYNIQKHLHAAALRAGEDRKSLDQLISWPRGIWNRTIIRDSPGHWAHVHVRIKCGPTETKCRSLN